MNRTEFLKTLFQYSEAFLELRPLPSLNRVFIPIDSDLSCIDRFCEQNGSDNLHFGVASRDGKGGRKENIVHIPAVWTDIDYKETPKQILKDRMQQFPFKPSIAVFSGGGIHLYWLLREPSGKEDIEAVEDVNRRITSVLGGDLNSCDAARILRLPDTANQKYENKPLCRVIHDADFTYTLDDFLGVLPEASREHRNTDQTEGNTNDGEGWLAEAMRGCEAGKRNATAAKLAGYWINKVSTSETLYILTSWNQLNIPPLPDTEIESVVKSVSRYEPTEKNKPKISIDNVYDGHRMLDEYREYVNQSDKVRFLTGIKPIDKQIRGVSGGEVLTIIARAGSFKTAALQNMLFNYASNSSWGACFFSIEMPIPNVTERYLQMSAGMPGQDIEDTYRGKLKNIDLNALESQFKNELKNLFVIPVKVSLADVAGYVQLLEREKDIKVGVIGIDYLQLIDGKGLNEYEVTSRLARQTKDLAKLLNIPAVLLSQVSRKGGDGEVEISMDMGRGSGAIEEGADFVLGLWQAPKDGSDGEFDLICRILKNRKGRKGSRWKLFIEPKTFWFSHEAEPYKPPAKGKKQNGF